MNENLLNDDIDGLLGSPPKNPKDPGRAPGLSPSALRFRNGWSAQIIPDEEAGPQYEVVDVQSAAPLIPAFPDAPVSKHFRLSEFRPGGCPLLELGAGYSLIRLSPMLVDTLEEIRERAGGYPLHITSGYRPPAYNRKVGGVSSSTHIDGLAADIYSNHVGTEELYDICDRVISNRGGVGCYPDLGFVHVDLRGHRLRW